MENLPVPIVVTEPSQLASMLSSLSDQPAIAVDTESNSLHAYWQRVCLIQFSVPGADYLVDPLSGLDLNPLGQVFSNPALEKIFHAAEYDVMCLRRDFGWTFSSLFDTMWAARVLGWPRSGLGAILGERFGVKLNKRWQRYDWGARPLAPEALAYARLDTHYLLPLRDRMFVELKEKGRLEEAREFFTEVACAEPNFRPFDSDRDLWRIKGVWDMEPRDRAVLRELLVWRDGEARRRDRPAFKILNDKTLIALAQTKPQCVEQMRGINGVKSFHQRRYGRQILGAIDRGAEAELPDPPPRSPRPSDKIFERYEALRNWRKKIARRRGVDPDVIVPNAALWTIAQRAPRSPDHLADLDALGPWKNQTYSEAILAVLNQTH